MDSVQLHNRFTYHKPKQDQPEVYEEIRSRARNYALYLNSVCPESKEFSLAITKLEEAVFWANASIARN